MKTNIIYKVGDTVLYKDNPTVYTISYIGNLVVIVSDGVKREVPFGDILPTHETLLRMTHHPHHPIPKQLEVDCIISIPKLDNGKNAFRVIDHNPRTGQIRLVNGFKNKTANMSILSKDYTIKDIHIILTRDEVYANVHPRYGIPDELLNYVEDDTE